MKAVLLSFLLSIPFPSTEVATRLQMGTVTVIVEGGRGSGVLRQQKEGWYCWTCAHVVSRVNGDVVLVGRKTACAKTGGEVLEFKVKAKIVLVDDGEDLALLQLLDDPPKSRPLAWHQGSIPKPGQQVYSCGTPLGHFVGTVSTGIVSALGREENGVVYDQCSAPTFPGNSGGAICGQDGACIGILSRGAGETISLYIPVRRVQAFAEKHKLPF